MKIICTTCDRSGELFMIRLFLLKYKWIPAYVKIVGTIGLSLSMYECLYRYGFICKSNNGRIYEGVNEQENY